LIHPGVVVDLLCIVLLSFHKAAANGDGVQFIGPDTSVQNLLEASLGVEIPFPLFPNDRNWKGPVFVAD